MRNNASPRKKNQTLPRKGCVFFSEYQGSMNPELNSWESKVPPPKLPPAINEALFGDYYPLVSLNKAFLGPAISWGGWGPLGGVP